MHPAQRADSAGAGEAEGGRCCTVAAASPATSLPLPRLPSAAVVGRVAPGTETDAALAAIAAAAAAAAVGVAGRVVPGIAAAAAAAAAAAVHTAARAASGGAAAAASTAHSPA
ncbi:unnamed protein product, partial [Closterium sp. NIES-54]